MSQLKGDTPDCESKTLAQAILDEQERCRELLTVYKQIGPHGAFGALHISDVLRRTEAAVMAGNTVAMLRLYDELKRCE